MTAKQYIKRKADLRQKYIEVFLRTPTEIQLFKMVIIAGKLNRIIKKRDVTGHTRKHMS